MTTTEKQGLCSRFLEWISPRYEVRVFTKRPIDYGEVFAGADGSVGFYYWERSANASCRMLERSRRVMGYNDFYYKVVKLR